MVPVKTNEEILNESLKKIADALIANHLGNKYNLILVGKTSKTQQALDHLTTVFNSLTHPSKDFNWSDVRNQFVDTFTGLACNS